MTDLEAVRKIWLQEEPEYKQLGIVLADELKRAIKLKGIWAEVQSRSKEIDSLIRKLLRK